MASSDEQDYPTAIVPTRPGSQHERFDALARRLGDPMARLFLLQNSDDPDMQFKAAAELMPYRYPKLKVSEVTHKGDVPGGINIQINIGAPPPDPRAARAADETVDVTPSPTLEEMLG